MIALGASRPLLQWFRMTLRAGGALSQLIERRIDTSVRFDAVVPAGWRPTQATDFDAGGRGLSRERTLGPARELVARHLDDSRACVIVEDLYAKAANFPCDSRSEVPWVKVFVNGHEELYWISDGRFHIRSPDAVLGAATGRRYVAVLSQLDSIVPDSCSEASYRVLIDVSRNATAVLAEIFDGESYLAAHLGTVPQNG